MEKLCLRDRFVALLVGFMGSLFVRMVGPTLRLEWVGVDNIERAEGEAGRKIFAFWHGELLTLAYTHRNRDICVLVSRHRDGECIARALQRLGFATARGSTSHGGLEGLFEMCKMLKNGRDLAITPDGPKGPRHRAQPGVVYLAQRAGVKILPMACVASKCIVLNTWDRFQIPLPFSKVVIAHGRPLHVPRELGVSALESHRRLVEEALVAAREKALARVIPRPKGRR